RVLFAAHEHSNNILPKSPEPESERYDRLWFFPSLGTAPSCTHSLKGTSWMWPSAHTATNLTGIILNLPLRSGGLQVKHSTLSSANVNSTSRILPHLEFVQ